MRLINADELKEWVENWFEKNRYYHPHSKANNIPIPELYDILERMPTVDAEPTEEQVKEYCRKRCLVVVDSALFKETVKHGHWNPWRCSKCGGRAPIHWDGEIRSYAEWRAPYCPSCGAKMDAPTQKSVGKALETLEANDDIR